MELREVAERVLFGTTLDEKLLLSPKEVTDYAPGKAIAQPEAPGRPEELCMSSKDERVSFPGLRNLENDHERGKMIHFLANHELLATELMALVLLKFPDAPKEFRMGVYETLKEEQAHTLMYMRRMKECGIHFGELPVNDYFWRMVAPMPEPIDFVTRLSLTFEQANLDFSRHYGKLFREIGDTGTARVLETIYQDEIEHVGHGLKWFRQWKDHGQSDWEAFNKRLVFPLTAAKAKGVAPFNPEGRKEAGLDEDFISRLEVSEQSRGRTPVVHMLNANAESYAWAEQFDKPFQPRKGSALLGEDLQMLPLSWSRKDDIILVDQMPSIEHLSYLRRTGLPMAEVVVKANQGALLDRKLGGFRPWAWTPEAVEQLRQLSQVETKSALSKFREPMPSRWMSKEFGVAFEKELSPETGSCWVNSVEQAVEVAEKIREDGQIALFKAPFSSAGRGHRKWLVDEAWSDSIAGWLKRVVGDQGGVVVEPWLDKVMDFSSQYELGCDGEVRHMGMTRVLNDEAGRFHGCYVHAKWASGLDPEMTRFLFRDADVMQVYRYDIPALLKQQLPGYGGPVGVDAMVYRDADGELKLRKVVEVNVRTTMGRVALELYKKSSPGRAGVFQIVRVSHLKSSVAEWLMQQNGGEQPTVEGGSIVLNDPSQAKEFLAMWHVRRGWGDFEGGLWKE